MKEELINKEFVEVVNLIRKAKYKAIKSVNEELIKLYWNVGCYISKKIENAEWGKGIITELADFIKKNYPDLKGYSNSNLWRMKQFYEIYKNNEKLATLSRELSWSNNLLILAKSKSDEEREFYINLCIKERYSFRELERQIDSCFYERTMLSNKVSTVRLQNTKVSALLRELPKDITKVFKDTYVLEFLDLPSDFSEKDLRKGLIKNFKQFILEFGKDFAFIGEEFKVQVGNNDYFIDLLFYHRELRCLVVFELKIDDFKPEYLGKLNFYLEALDRDVKKEYENPSVGVILCKDKDKEVVEYSLNRNLSPALISEYKTKLIDKKLLQEKLHEFSMLVESLNKD